VEVAGLVAEQVLEVLVAGRFPQGGADQQVPDPGAAQVEGDAGVCSWYRAQDESRCRPGG